MATLIDRETVEVGAQREANEIPGVGRQASAVEEEQRRAAAAAPVEVVKPQPVDHDVMLGGQRQLGDLDAGDVAGQAEVRQRLGPRGRGVSLWQVRPPAHRASFMISQSG